MADAFDQGDVERAITFLLGDLDLARGAVLVVLALHDLDGHADVTQRLGDIPVAEAWIEPSAVPAEEGVVDIAMPAREPWLQIALDIVLSRLPDRLEPHLLDDEMRREQNDSAYAVILHAARIERRDRGAV